MTTRPASIQAFDRVFFAGLGLSALASAINWNAIVAMTRDARLAALGLGPGFVVGSLVVSFAIYLVLWFFIARRASNVAKWLFVVLTALSVLNFVQALATPAARLGLPQLLAALALVLQVYAAWLLFRPDAKAWLEGRNPDPRGPVE